jgi:hypothetical protein
MVMGRLIRPNQKLKWALRTKRAGFEGVVTERSGERYVIEFTKRQDRFALAVPRQWIDDCEVGRPVPEPLDGYIEWLEARFVSRQLRQLRQPRKR